MAAEQKKAQLTSKHRIIEFFHDSLFKQHLIHNGNSLSFLRRLARHTAQGEDFIKKTPSS